MDYKKLYLDIKKKFDDTQKELSDVNQNLVKKNDELIDIKYDLDNVMNELSEVYTELDKTHDELCDAMCKLDIANYELNKITDDINNKTILKTINKHKGGKCSIEGNKYEYMVYNIVKETTLNNKKFNTQKEEELGGSRKHNDLICNYKKDKNIGIEIKKRNTPDWMQCSIKYNKENKKWYGSENGKIPIESRKVFNKLLNKVKLFNGNMPPFIEKNITYDEWIEIKKNTIDFDDTYIDIPNDTIKYIYSKKGCYYIQISDYGLYHLGNDICNFDVPEFIVEQQLRIRIKVHKSKNKQGFCVLSITASCKPKDITKLKKSKFSLDSIDKLPINLTCIQN
jgi:hypothetical protein